MLLLLAFLSITNRPAVAQFNTPTVDGVISTGEYGTHTDGNNQQTNSGTVWYMTWDATNLYIGISGANVAESAVIYVDGNPIAPINGGTNADGTLVGQPYDNTNFAALQFRADHVSFFKDGYREHRTANGANGWSGATTFSGSYFSNGSNVREYAIPWSNITGGGIPSSFNWFGYVTSGGGFVYGEMPTENGGGTIGTSAREQRYFTVSTTTNGASTKPFSRNSYVFNSTSDISGFGGISVFDFTMNSSGRQIFRSSDASTWTIGGNLRVDAGTIHFDNTTGAATVSGNVVISSGATLNLGNVVGGDLNLAGSWTNNGTFNHNSRTVTFNGTGTRTISGSSTTNFGFLTVNMSSSASILETLSPITMTSGNLTLTQGTLKISSASTMTPFSGSETIPANAGYHLNHASAVSNWGSSGTLTLNGTLTIDNGTMTVGSSTGNELELTSSTSSATINGGTLNLASRVRVVSSSAGNGLVINGGEVIVTTNANGSSSVAGFNMNSSGKFTMTGGTVTVQNANTGSVGDVVLVSGTGAKSVTGGTFRFGNALTPAGQVMKINSGIPIFHLVVNSANATAQLLTNSLDVNGDLSINAGTLNANLLNLNLAGNWSNSGTFTPGTGTVTLDGSSGQTLTGATTFNNLTVNNAAGVTLANDQTANGTLTLTSGNISTGSNKMIIAAGGSVSRTSGHVVGNLQKNFVTGSGVTHTFEVGTGSDYTPTAVTIASVSTAGNVTAKSTVGDHASIGSSTLDANKSVNRNWTLTSDGALAFSNYDATFNFVAGDLDGGTSTSNLIVGKLDGGMWTYPTVGTRTATSTQATGMTSFSDFQLAEMTAPAATATVSGDATICAGSSTTLTATLTGTPPWNLTWSDSYVQNGVTTSPATRSVSPTTTTIYTLASFSDANGPGTSSGSATVTVNPMPAANAGANLATASSVLAKLGANPTASGASPFTYSWSPATGLSSTSTANPTATPTSTTTYTLTVTDANGCITTDQVNVRAGNLVNSSIQRVIGPTNLYDPVLNQVRADIAIKNISGVPIYGPLTAVFKTLTPGPPTITIPNADGGGSGIGCYYDYSNLLGPDNVLSPGETTGFKLWIFQENVLPAVNFKFFANVAGDLDGFPKSAAGDEPLAFTFDLQKGVLRDDADSKLTDDAAEIPMRYALYPNHPNPFNPSTTMQFDLPQAGKVTLKIYNSVGQLVRTLVEGDYVAGKHKVIWDAQNGHGARVASGVYIAVLHAGNSSAGSGQGFTAQQRLVLMK